LLERLLAEVGFHVRVAENGAGAVEIFRMWRPHFIWMDVRLPMMSGLEVARCIRALDGGRSVTIVALTASAFTEQRQEVLAAGMDDFVRKPYQPREIFECMGRHLGARYLYRDGSVPAGEPASALLPDALAALPPELRGNLKEALISLDVARIAGLIGQVSEQDAVLGTMLVRCADKFAYTAILNGLEDGNYGTKTA